jgi:hypothetical protein
MNDLKEFEAWLNSQNYFITRLCNDLESDQEFESVYDTLEELYERYKGKVK